MALKPEWAGEAAFVICGGPSVKQQNLDLLRGRRVVVVNRSFVTYPEADILIFADANCWTWYRDGIANFKGRVVTVYDHKPSGRFPERFEQYRKTRPPILSADPNCITLQRTTTTGAIHVLAHLGVKLIVTLGLDGKFGADGSSHHHGAHPKPANAKSWAKHAVELHSVKPSLAALGVTVLNASPNSAHDAFPIVSLEDAVAHIDARMAA